MKEESIFSLLQTVSSEKTSARAVNALGSLYSRLHKQVYEACSRICEVHGKSKYDAEDLAHDVWEKITRKAHLFNPKKNKAKTEEKKFLTWIGAIAQNILREQKRTSVDERLQNAEFFEAIEGVSEDNPKPGLYEKAREFLEGLADHEQDILFTSIPYLPGRVPQKENKRLRTTHNLTQLNVRQIRYRLIKQMVILLTT